MMSAVSESVIGHEPGAGVRAARKQSVVLQEYIRQAEQAEHDPADQFFEGAEKLLELWFSVGEDSTSLRSIPRCELDEICAQAQCEIIGETHNKKMSAYVLSESSLFVGDDRLVLKTCGTTRPLYALEKILDCAKQYANMQQVANVFYSRKNFVRPNDQCDLHQNIDAEAKYLDNFFQNSVTYCLGNLRNDRWYFYTLNNPNKGVQQIPDQTMEILMQDLDPKAMNIFTKETCEDGEMATKLSGIDKLMPADTVIDDMLFEPCGYSMNALIADTEEYCTIHVTPQPDFSYVSFETNQAQQCWFTQINQVLECFRPERFLMSLWANHESVVGRAAQTSLWNRKLIGYSRCDLQMVMNEECTVVYARYIKDTAQGVVRSDEGIATGSDSD